MYSAAVVRFLFFTHGSDMLLVNNKWMVRAITVDLNSIMQIHKHFYNCVIFFFYILTYFMHLNTALLPLPRR